MQSRTTTTYIATLPRQFGRVIRFEERRGRVVAIAEHGEMILPIRAEGKVDLFSVQQPQPNIEDDGA